MPMDSADAGFTLARDIACNFDAAARHEWLVTNGLGGFACGTISGANTRRYHGLLVASLRPPVQRVLLVAKIDVRASYRGEDYELGTNEFSGGTLSPRGLIHIERFELLQRVPTWTYAFSDALLRLRIFMAPERNTSYLLLSLLRASAPVKLELRPFCTNRDYHAHLRGPQPIRLQSTQSACLVQIGAGEPALQLSIDAGGFRPNPDWFWNFHHRSEAERGLDALEDLYTPGSFFAELLPDASVAVTASIEPTQTPAADILLEITERNARCIEALPREAPAWIRELALAADAFIVQRKAPDGTPGLHGGLTVIAGYPWFADWGRDTMIAVPGLTAYLGRGGHAQEILATYAGWIDGGMIPNCFSDGASPPQYNAADASLWLFHAFDECRSQSPGADWIADFYPALANIIRAHLAGTRFGIGIDERDSLLRIGEPGVQLTWMDAKVGSEVITPRAGKPVEINALWLNALHIMRRLARSQRDDWMAETCSRHLERGSKAFARFWNAERRMLYDVIDVEGGDDLDASFRPNQILAVSLKFSALNPVQMRAIVDACASALLTCVGLRSLDGKDSRYCPRYTGDQARRDRAYHQGTVWNWLLGPFALAHFRAYGNAALAQSFLEPLALHLREGCVGFISEIFDASAPHEPRGAFAQAWSVGETLRAWLRLQRERSKIEESH